MRLLLDECLPRQLKRKLTGHQVFTVPEMGWASKRNGELLALMKAAGFDAFLTIDRNLEYQQRLEHDGVSLLVLTAKNNTLPVLLPLLPEVQRVLPTVKPGAVILIGGDKA